MVRVVAEPLAPAEGAAGPRRLLKGVLRAFAALFLVAAFLYGIGPLLPAFRSFFRELPFVSNSVVKVTLLSLCCLYAAGDLRRRHGLVLVLIAAHLVSVAAMLLLLVTGRAGGTVALGGTSLATRTTLWAAIAVDGVILLLFVLLYLLARPRWGAAPRRAAAEKDANVGTDADLEPAERRLVAVLQVLGGAFAIGAVGYEAGAFLAPTAAFFRELPFVTNSVVKVSLLAMLCFYIAHDLRRQLGVMYLLIVSHAVSVIVMLVYLAAADAGRTIAIVGWSSPVSAVLWAAVLLDGAIFAGLLWLTQAAWYARHPLRFFRPIEYRTLIALADVLVRGEDERVPPGDIAANVDRYISQIRARRRVFQRYGLFALWLHPLLLAFKAPFSELSEEERLRHLRSRFQKAVRPHPIPERPPPLPPFAPLRRLRTFLRRVRTCIRRHVPILIRLAQQLTYVGYYNDRRSFGSVGYVPFSERARARDLEIPERKPHPLEVEEPGDVRGPDLEADVCVIGSGAGGAVLAYFLAERGRDVLILERGQYVEPRQFTEDEVEMIGKLYADGMFQQSEDFRFTVLQGSCVGGSTVVNNAVSFDPPEHVLARWNDPGRHDAGLHLPELREDVRQVSSLIEVTRQNETHLNPSAPKFVDGVERLGLPGQGMELDVVRANLKGCFGSGYCNIGCPWGKKLSMLDRVLPEAQKRFPGRVRILAECEARRLVTQTGPVNRVASLLADLSDGRGVRVRARDYVVAAGAVSSPHLLLRSGVGRGLPVGRRASFNMGAALTAEFDEKLDAYDGLQISHYLEPDPSRGWVIETWWNPPVAQALNMPGWFEDHFDNMRRYDHMMAAGVLVGTEGNGRIKASPLGGPGIDYTPTVGDLRKMADGLTTLGEILFAGRARRLMLNAWGYEEFESVDDLERLERIVLDPSYVTLGSGHPQGGCPLSRDPRKGVVNADFRVHGYHNLYVCDASVFPTSLTVNPQLTVMGLARYAARTIR